MAQNSDTLRNFGFGGPVPQGNVGFALYSSSARFDNFQVDYNGYTWSTANSFTLGPGAVGGIIHQRSGGTNKWHHYDAIGNVMELTNQSGLQYASYEQEAFGNVLSGSSSGYHLTTKEYDGDVGLYYFWMRWYDPTLGRFTQRDAVSRMNRYAYCRNNPLRWVDPAGKFIAPIHAAITFQSCIAAGISIPMCMCLAAASVLPDIPPQSGDPIYHDPQKPLPQAGCDCKSLGALLHRLQDNISHEPDPDEDWDWPGGGNWKNAIEETRKALEEWKCRCGSSGDNERMEPYPHPGLI